MIRLICFVLAINLKNVDANKYCSYELNGEPKYFICARNEYCCNFGCCVHLAFQFYQLWYYWLLLIFMFMICSGGSWWYKFCRQNDTSIYPSIPQTVERAARQNIMEAQARRARALNRAAAIDSSSLYMQRIWKANGIAPPPNYYTASVVRYHSASDIESRRQQQECPYYQLYGPPPSYESVVQISETGRGQASCVLFPPALTLPLAQQSAATPTTSTTIVQQQTPDSPTSITIAVPSTSTSHSAPQLGLISTPSSATSSSSSSPQPSSSASSPASSTSPSSPYLNNSMIQNCQLNPIPSTSEQFFVNSATFNRQKHNRSHQRQHHAAHHHHHHNHHHQPQPLTHNRNNDEATASIPLQTASIIRWDRMNSIRISSATTTAAAASASAPKTSSSTSTEPINESGTRV